jgi:diaminohydroxyphosphoribosylaminopyrimidine deaminase/5-amino-6-(5-phosphoribosylamino)uracil reductase
MTFDELAMRRCFELARLGEGRVAPNPLVGAVVACGGRIIGEGYHADYGGPHAEVVAIASVREKQLLPSSTLYVSLEPCAHHGKTPPCTDLILANNIARVVVSCTDPNPLVAGRGIQRLRDAGVSVILGLLEQEGRWLIRYFTTFYEKKRPHIVLKYAKSKDGFMAREGQNTKISGETAQRLVHRWRSELAAIMVGTNTALIDNPRLDNRLFFGTPPLRVVLDRQGTLKPEAYLLDGFSPTLVFGEKPSSFNNTQTEFVRLPTGQEDELEFVLDYLCNIKKINSLLVEGGARLLNALIEAKLWDEARIFTGNIVLGRGIVAPALPDAALAKMERVGEDELLWLLPKR